MTVWVAVTDDGVIQAFLRSLGRLSPDRMRRLRTRLRLTGVVHYYRMGVWL